MSLSSIISNLPDSIRYSLSPKERRELKKENRDNRGPTTSEQIKILEKELTTQGFTREDIGTFKKYATESYEFGKKNGYILNSKPIENFNLDAMVINVLDQVANSVTSLGKKFNRRNFVYTFKQQYDPIIKLAEDGTIDPDSNNIFTKADVNYSESKSKKIVRTVGQHVSALTFPLFAFLSGGAVLSAGVQPAYATDTGSSIYASNVASPPDMNPTSTLESNLKSQGQETTDCTKINLEIDRCGRMDLGAIVTTLDGTKIQYTLGVVKKGKTAFVKDKGSYEKQIIVTAGERVEFLITGLYKFKDKEKKLKYTDFLLVFEEEDAKAFSKLVNNMPIVDNTPVIDEYETRRISKERNAGILEEDNYKPASIKFYAVSKDGNRYLESALTTLTVLPDTPKYNELKKKYDEQQQELNKLKTRTEEYKKKVKESERIIEKPKKKVTKDKVTKVEPKAKRYIEIAPGYDSLNNVSLALRAPLYNSEKGRILIGILGSYGISEQELGPVLAQDHHYDSNKFDQRLHSTTSLLGNYTPKELAASFSLELGKQNSVRGGIEALAGIQFRDVALSLQKTIEGLDYGDILENRIVDLGKEDYNKFFVELLGYIKIPVSEHIDIYVAGGAKKLPDIFVDKIKGQALITNVGPENGIELYKGGIKPVAKAGLNFRF